MKQPDNKRSYIPDWRRKQLFSPKAVYAVNCHIPDCLCPAQEKQCTRGFFSLFIQAIYGIVFARANGIPYYINYGNVEYPYSSLTPEHKFNFWNNYFEQAVPDENEADKTLVENRFIEVYPLRVWSKKHIRLLHNEGFKHISFKPEILKLIEQDSKQFNKQKVLGVQIRRTDHGQEIHPVSHKAYLMQIKKELKHYDRLFIATDSSQVSEEFKQLFPDKYIDITTQRSSSDQPLHIKPGQDRRFRLGYEVLRDCYLLSRCDKAILMHSNISYAALIMNPDLPYTLMERWPTRLSKWKTLLVYYLNEWGIRKW